MHHSAELIYINNGWSIGTLSEEPLESNNKFVRRYLQQYSRTTSPVLQLTDTLTRLLERSHPEVIEHQAKFHNKNLCAICSGRHKTENHESSAVQNSTCLDMFDSLVSDYIVQNTL